MALKTIKTALPEVVVFEPDIFTDKRGFFMELYHSEKYNELGLTASFVQDNFSRSSRGTLRGLHYQLDHPQGKLVCVMQGEVFDVAVDIRRGSPGFGRWVGQVLSANNRRQMFVPEGFAHGFCVLSETADFLYKCTDVYHPEDDRGINCLDAALDIDWPIQAPLLSEKDAALPLVHDVPAEQLPTHRKPAP